MSSATMKAAYIEKTGPAQNIKIGELPRPIPKGSEVLVRVRAVAVNPIDTYIRAGMIQAPIPSPYILGCDLAGVVEAVGPQATKYKVGDRVWGSNQGLMGRQGTFAEFASVNESWLYPMPPHLFPQEMAAVALVGITAHLGLFLHAGLKPGETVYVAGGTGGVGACVVQMAKAAGARVITSAGSEPKVARCKAIGADIAFDYRQKSPADVLKEHAPAGVDVWWETQREPNFELAVPQLAKRGRMVVMAGRDAKPTFPVGPFYTKDCSIVGFAMFNASPDEQAVCAADINRWMASGKLRASIDRSLPLSESVLAHQLQEGSTLQKSGKVFGKIVLFV